MAFRKISYPIPSCDGCGLAWSFFDQACAEGIPPHFASRAAALEQLPRDYGWQIRSRRFGHPLMACRICAAAGVIPEPPATSAVLLSAGQRAVAVVVAELNRIVGPVLATGLDGRSPSAGRAG